MIVDESDLIPENDLEEPREIAEKRRAAIAATPIPETAAPPIWNPKSRAGVRFATGVAGPAIGGAMGGTAGGVGGAMIAEGVDALMSPPEERPSLSGAAARVGLQAAIPPVLNKAAQTLAPLTKQIPSVLPKAALESKAAAIARGVVHRAGLFKSLTTEEKGVLDGIVQETTKYSPLIDAKDLLAALEAKAPIFGKDEFSTLLSAFKDAAKAGNGTLSLPELHVIMRTARSQAKTRFAKQAIALVKKDVLDTMEQHITATHPKGATLGPMFRRLNNEIGTKLGIAEDAIDLIHTNPMRAIQHIAGNENALRTVQALDSVAGTNFAPQIRSFGELLRLEGQKAATAASLKISQESARKLLRGMLTTSAIGSGGLTNVLLALLVGRQAGTLPLETPAAHVARWVAKSTPGLLGAAGKGAEALFGKQAPVAPFAAAVPEDDLLADESEAP